VTSSLPCPGPVVPASPASAALGALREFRERLRGCLTARGDALFDLADAVLCSGGPVRFSFEFADEQGGPLHPADVTYAFHMIAYLAGLPPVRLHDLRHWAATLLLAAGHDMKVVQETLGLSSITIAGDTYTSVLPQLARQSAEDVAALVCPSQIPSPRRRGKRQERPGSGDPSRKPAM
jgi:integrase